MIIGIGVDILQIQRMKDIVDKNGKVFLEKIFTKRELEYAYNKKDYVSHLSTLFAGKEAVFKAFGTGWSGGVRLQEIEIKHEKSGNPTVSLSGRFEERAIKLKIKKIFLSLSFDTEYAIAFAMLIR